MKHLKFYLTALLAVLAFPQMSRAQDMANGKVQALIVVGQVQLIAPDGTVSDLKRGQSFEQGNKVHASKGGNALLVMSNGATLKVKEDTTLDVAKFQQAKYDEAAEGTFLRLTKDPSQSDTDLKLSTGSLQGEVKKLNTGAGSKFSVDTPAGSAGIRGTIIDITIVTDASGKITGIIANCLVGAVDFTPAANVVITSDTGGGKSTTVSNANISTGGSMTVNLTVGPDGSITGGTLTGGTLGANDAQGIVNDLYNSLNSALTQAGLPNTPPPSMNGTQSNPVQIIGSDGTTYNVVNNQTPGSSGTNTGNNGSGSNPSSISVTIGNK